jgi:hypothetical protein
MSDNVRGPLQETSRSLGELAAYGAGWLIGAALALTVLVAVPITVTLLLTSVVTEGCSR